MRNWELSAFFLAVAPDRCEDGFEDLTIGAVSPANSFQNPQPKRDFMKIGGFLIIFVRMRGEYRLTLVGSLAIILFEGVSALLASKFGISCVFLIPVSILIYFLVAYRAARYLNAGGAIAFGAFLGLVDATIGCKLSTLLGGDTTGVLKSLTFSSWCGMVIWAMISGIVISLAAFLIPHPKTSIAARSSHLSILFGQAGQ